MSIVERYHLEILKILETIKDKEMENIEKAAQWVAQTVLDDSVYYVFGTGAHSIMPAMELFLRAGNLANSSGIFPPGLTDFDGHPKTERITGFSDRVYDYYGVNKGDVLLLCNVNGINPMTIDAAEVAKRRGYKTIGVTSIDFQKNVDPDVPNRHTSNKNLCDLVDLVIDAHVPVGDALLNIDGVPVPVGPGSTYPMIFIVNSIVARAVEICVEKGYDPPIMKSGNVKGGAEYNAKYREKYGKLIRHYE